ncbi:MAG: class I SAM-dependent methyltransferase [Melioribacter sp.]|nr:class I SAM-dependent methyltransferase [Melioribacter sp.]
MHNWYKEWFDSPDYLRVYNHRDFLDAQKLSNLILSFTKIPKTAKILDAACGAGRHAIYLSLCGYNVFGFDLSRNLLLQAKKESFEKNANLKLIQADIREICFKKVFDMILNLFTSFGYFETDEENFSFIRKSYCFLKDNGYYVLDYFNKSFLEQNLLPYSEKLVENIKVIEKRKIENNRVVKEIILIKNNLVERFYESVKLYSIEKIIEEFERAKFRVLKIFGDYDGSDYNEKESPRLIIVFQK